MKVIYTLKQLTQGTRLWGAGNLVVMSDADAEAFCADKKDPNGIDIQGKDFAKVPTITGKVKTVAAPASADFTFATRILKASPTNAVNPTVVRYAITAAVDSTNKLLVTFTLDSKAAVEGSLDLGDGTTKPWPAGTDTLTYTYTAGGAKTAAFTPGEPDGVVSSVNVTPVAPKTFAIATTITDLSVDFTVTPKAAGKLDFGDDSTPVDLTSTTNTATYAYAAAGTYDVTFTPTNTYDTAKTVSVTVTEPAAV